MFISIAQNKAASADSIDSKAVDVTEFVLLFGWGERIVKLSDNPRFLLNLERVDSNL